MPGALSGKRPPRALRRLVAMPLVLLMLATTAPTAEAAFWSSVPAYPIKSKCVGRDSYGNPTIAWRGGEKGDINWNPYHHLPHGKMYLCYTTYRLGKKTADGDYYAVDLETVWRRDECPYGCDYLRAKMTQSAFSDVSSKDSRFGWTPTYTSQHSCSTTVSVGFSAGPISVSTGLSVCSGITVRRHYAISTGAGWGTDYVHRTPVIQTSFSQKVRHGAVPTFDILFAVPYYKYEQISTTQWRVTESWKHFHYTPSGTV